MSEPPSASAVDSPTTTDSAAATEPDRDSSTDTAAERPIDGPPALVVDGVSKRFGSGEGSVLAVDDVSLTVERGSIVGLLGPNGAGKTTLIKCALGVVLPDTGSVRVFGVDIGGSGHRAAYANVDAMLEGARNDYWRLTVRENLRYFATIRGIDPDSVADRHDRLLERLELVDKADTAVRDLSRGMKQKVSLASVLAGGAELVFLDEPTLGLDVESSRTLRRELRRLAVEEGLTIVVSSHDMAVIEDVCDRVVMMADGRIVADDTVSALLSGADRDAVRVTSPDIDDDVLAALRDRFEVRSVAVEGDRTSVEVAAAGDDLYALMDALRAAGVTIGDVRTVQPDLEEVFVDVTGMEVDVSQGVDDGGRSS
ncbi:ABC-2 type transport system ATP-binding protein [Halorubrum alkaliphilum]|uniref:ABC-2 type transport system ATP-binding protein n=1 Tax=Halorubrum alkaliphilum TaxID=261290 RepID=A0A8T4GLW6_9EURY|nr:ABC transporter ATP-binding protein [Halorubrum alkaliphilum]MBP1923965.1 ABC-2 type transport system ATP-binding protein [Halorubrum alkaliphilum]